MDNFEHRRSFITFTFFITLFAFIGFGVGTYLYFFSVF